MDIDVEANEARRESYPSLYDIHKWKLDGLCNGSPDLFDLEEEDKFGAPGARKRNIKRVKEAKPICFQCPVFNECSEDALANVKMVNGVIRAGARLGNGFASKRRLALELAKAEREHYWRHRGE